jgi:hypothetical protein
MGSEDAPVFVPGRTSAVQMTAAAAKIAVLYQNPVVNPWTVARAARSSAPAWPVT